MAETLRARLVASEARKAVQIGHGPATVIGQRRNPLGRETTNKVASERAAL